MNYTNLKNLIGTNSIELNSPTLFARLLRVKEDKAILMSIPSPYSNYNLLNVGVVYSTSLALAFSFFRTKNLPS